jgi:hypothetical protein
VAFGIATFDPCADSVRHWVAELHRGAKYCRVNGGGFYMLASFFSKKEEFIFETEENIISLVSQCLVLLRSFLFPCFFPFFHFYICSVPFFSYLFFHFFHFYICSVPFFSYFLVSRKLNSKLARANSAARFDKVILIYDLLFILLKSSTLNLHIDISASISKLVSVHPNFVAWVVLDWWMEI